ncbi:MAG: cation transporter [Planctomycetaceae bacterium]|nr:cation transporter [Planctomycetaceae bacterium]
MAHCHSHDHKGHDYSSAFAIGVGLNVAFIVLEATGGIAIGSMALLADAGHNLSDVLGLLLAWGAVYLSRKSPNERYTYGLRSSTILAALSNSLLLILVVGGIAWESMRRLLAPTEVPGGPVVAIAAAGVVINTATALLFLRGRHHDLNIRGAYLHMAADAGVSLAVMLGGLGMMTLGWPWLDPVLSLLIAALILWSTWGLLRDSVNLALHAVPAQIDLREVQQFLLEQPGVSLVHDLHVWAMSTTETALTAHLVRPENGDADIFLSGTAQGLHDRFGIEHATLQIERVHDPAACRQAHPDAV